ncbi:hypothetical protein GE21DRAFT_1216733 [Neurospora crassa]|uniref:Uncharacterized protein B24G20.110 n=1 Tax=Neurospora crassa TaxID=5141 RepID=Q872H8_NEUCS|nr:hypothetical protein GE21DRAFT_1216733 [Neurospora crassa]CAD70753.1 hypothetical protein [Neurospora crassa]
MGTEKLAKEGARQAAKLPRFPGDSRPRLQCREHYVPLMRQAGSTTNKLTPSKAGPARARWAEKVSSINQASCC